MRDAHFPPADNLLVACHPFYNETVNGDVGQARSVPLYDSVSGGGNNSVYNIVGFAGIRVVYFCLGGQKEVVLQPAVVIDDSAFHGNANSYSVYKRVVLAQ